MKNLRLSFIFLLIFTGFVLNIERLDIGNQMDIVNIQSFHYVLLGIVALSAIIIPSMRRVPIGYALIFWTVIYLLCKLVVFRDRPFLSGIYLYLSITELVFLGIMVILSHRVADDLYDFENMISNLNLTGVSKRVMEFGDAGDSIAYEFIRSRRYQTPLSVLLIKLDKQSIKHNSDQSIEGLFQEMLTRYSSNSLVRLLDRELRRTDLIIQQPHKNRLILLFPETDAQGTNTMVNRIRELSNDVLGVDISCGFATFPDEAITFDELVKRAENHFKVQSMYLADVVADEVEKMSGIQE